MCVNHELDENSYADTRMNELNLSFCYFSVWTYSWLAITSPNLSQPFVSYSLRKTGVAVETSCWFLFVFNIDKVTELIKLDNFLWIGYSKSFQDIVICNIVKIFEL